ncbi:MAG: YCF48-related protein [Bacteroidetes bacterium]|nr:YCF48-related protein [Bacteroidota bacterium]
MNGGDNWYTQQVFEYNLSIIRSLYFINDSIGYGGGAYYDIENDDIYSCIVKTLDKGETWEIIYLTQNTSYSIRDLFFTDTINGWAVGTKPYQQYFLMHTDNGGETWEEQTIACTPEPNGLDCVYFVNDTTGWIGGAGSGFGVIYFTHNGGEDWQLQQELYSQIGDIQMLNCDTGWAVGADYIYHTTNGDTILINGVNENKPKKDFFAIYPNPTNGIFMIKTAYKSPMVICWVLITNLYGDPVFQLNNVTIEQSNSQFIDLSYHPAGIYFITIKYTADNQINTFTKKIMKL